ncbi:MAG: hypothetical protein KF880_07850 [Ferruginibacter sp.]|nr:hypothetical protein [Ferruginibacter sp.]
MWKYFLLWFPMLALAILNGTVRDLGYKKYVGELTAHQISTVTLLLLFGIYIWFVIKNSNITSPSHAIYLGVCWVGLTLCFEFGFGLARGNTFSKLLEDYNLLRGRIWVLIPVWLLIAPYIFYKLKQN